MTCHGASWLAVSNVWLAMAGHVFIAPWASHNRHLMRLEHSGHENHSDRKELSLRLVGWAGHVFFHLVSEVRSKDVGNSVWYERFWLCKRRYVRKCWHGWEQWRLVGQERLKRSDLMAQTAINVPLGCSIQFSSRLFPSRLVRVAWGKGKKVVEAER